MADILRQLRISLQKAQEQQAAEANNRRRSHPFQEGDQVHVSTKDLPITYATGVDDHRKVLHHKNIGPFELGRRRGESAFEMVFLAHWQISRTQNVSKLKPSLIDHTRERHRHQPMSRRCKPRGSIPSRNDQIMAKEPSTGWTY